MSHSRSSDIEESEDSEGTQYSEEKWHARRLTGIVFCITFTACFAAICIIAITSHGSGDIHAICVRNELLLTKLNNSIPTDEVQVAMIGHLLGEQRLKKLMATMLALVSFLAIIIATCTSTIEINLDREKMPPDFEMKGTLSNVAQDTAQPNGRMFTAGLFTYGLLLINSSYTIYLYRSWAPWVQDQHEQPQFQNPVEQFWRCLWLVFPNVCFMFTASFPSLSDPSGLNFWLAVVHNVCAPCGMAIVVIMEAVQLHFGESAFEFFWNSEPTPVYGPLSFTQRTRVVVVIFTWLSFIIFLSCQVYLGLGSVVGIKIKTSYALAEISYYGEVIGLVLVGLLPFLAGIGILIEEICKPSVAQMAMVALYQKSEI